jgi:hypothetical protein
MPKGFAVVLGFYLGWQSALLIDCVVQDIKRTHNVVPFTANMAIHLARTYEGATIRYKVQ